ncbi:MAG: ATP-dependent DNA helicase [Proteobacteria bacterium]|nr:ATP-dependent DNA helicase [Pseudomonadota bacterium]MBU1737264.1 ATP-dependent DNA helicase [Pseudomonadota bacterium]
MKDIFGRQGVLAEKLPGYEFRPGQLALAESVWRTLEDRSGRAYGEPGLLVAEAGTGIGKTLAYLVPAALSGQRVVISTGTLNLQDQIIEKEIPFIREHLDRNLEVTCVKGRQNYLCLYRWRQVAATPQHRLFATTDELEAIGEWLQETTSGDRAELEWLADGASLWSAVSASASQCLGSNCPDGAECFINRLRKEAAYSRLLIVNHHLFFSDLALRRYGHAEVLPRYEAVVFDEAHHIEEVATRYFGVSFSHYQAIDLARDIEQAAEADLPKERREPTVQLARALASQADRLVSILPVETGRFDLDQAVAGVSFWPGELAALDGCFSSLAANLDALQGAELWGGFFRRCSELQGNLTAVTSGQDDSMIYWLERRERTVVLSASPIEVADELSEHLYNRVSAAVFASATLVAGKDFGFFLNRLGLPPDTETMALPTPFDYQGRSCLYVPGGGFPSPGTEHYAPAVQEEICSLIEISGGRTLVLFTSMGAMQQTFDYLVGRLPYNVLVQGMAPRAVLLDAFINDVSSVLLAVASFWEGVDVPGESLSCVIVDKLPFEVPSDPVVKARIERVRKEGGNPFFDYQVPRAVLTLRQGLGRLMRSMQDRGALAVLDTRLFGKSYGRIFLQSLPPSPVVRSLEGVRAFWRDNGSDMA